MAEYSQGKQSVKFRNPPVIRGAASVAGSKEGEGPYGEYFDIVLEDDKLGCETWEEAEGKLQELAVENAVKKAGLTKKDIRYLFAGDLLGQLMASSFGLLTLNIPVFGVYGACSTMGETISLGSMVTEGGFADHVVAVTSSHFASAEKQFRFPLAYGNQRPKAATWTVTGSGAVVISRSVSSKNSGSKTEHAKDTKEAVCEKEMVKVLGITTGKIVDLGIKDSMNMGACMAPAAGEAIVQNLIDFGYAPEEYDKIITGDLGLVGKDILIDYVKTKGYDIADRYMDCGIEIFARSQEIQAGGSGCGCSATMLTGYILKMIEQGSWKKVLFVPTGALISPVSFNEGNAVPGVAHAVILSK